MSVHSLNLEYVVGNFSLKFSPLTEYFASSVYIYIVCHSPLLPLFVFLPCLYYYLVLIIYIVGNFLFNFLSTKYFASSVSMYCLSFTSSSSLTSFYYLHHHLLLSYSHILPLPFIYSVVHSFFSFLSLPSLPLHYHPVSYLLFVPEA